MVGPTAFHLTDLTVILHDVTLNSCPFDQFWNSLSYHERHRVGLAEWPRAHDMIYPMIIMIIPHPFPPHHPIPRQVINLGELDSQRVVDGLQKISQFLDSYEKERSAELLEGVLDLLSP